MSLLYANLGRSNGTRHPLDCYMTPGEVTRGLLRAVKLKGPVLEPAAGPLRLIVAELRAAGLKTTGTDLSSGHDFLARTAPWPGDIVTNPPYRDGLELAFTEHALRLARGRVAMLLRTSILHGTTKHLPFFLRYPPELVLIVPWRIKFIQATGQPISGQGYDHSWFVWGNKKVYPGETKLQLISPES